VSLIVVWVIRMLLLSVKRSILPYSWVAWLALLNIWGRHLSCNLHAQQAWQAGVLDGSLCICNYLNS
jgi:hypothetical protein